MNRYLEKLEKRKRELQERLQKARMDSEQDRARKLREKKHRVKGMKPGAKRAILEGLMYRKSPLEVMREEWERRKQKQ